MRKFVLIFCLVVFDTVLFADVPPCQYLSDRIDINTTPGTTKSAQVTFSLIFSANTNVYIQYLRRPSTDAPVYITIEQPDGTQLQLTDGINGWAEIS